MESNQTLSPAQILEYNEAFAKSLQLLADTTQHQINGIVDTTLRICQAIAALGNQPPQPGGGMPADLKADLKAMLEPHSAAKAISTAEVLPGNRAGKDEADAQEFNPEADNLQGIIHALGLAQQNTVSAQQQLNMLAQASMNMGITQLFAATAKMYNLEVPGMQKPQQD